MNLSVVDAPQTLLRIISWMSRRSTERSESYLKVYTYVGRMYRIPVQQNLCPLDTIKYPRLVSAYDSFPEILLRRINGFRYDMSMVLSIDCWFANLSVSYHNFSRHGARPVLSCSHRTYCNLYRNIPALKTSRYLHNGRRGLVYLSYSGIVCM